MTHTERLQQLALHGWICPLPNTTHTIGKDDPVRTVHILGTLWDKPAAAWLCIETGLVMVHGDADYEFVRFVQMLETGIDPDAPVAVKAVRGLFDDDGES